MAEIRQAFKIAGWFLLGALYGVVAFLFAMFLGSGAGHGTDDFGRITLAPFTLGADSVESVAPFLGFVFWALVFALLGSGRPGAVVTSSILLVIHYMTAFMIFVGLEDRFKVPWAFIIVLPYLVGQVLVLVRVVWQFRRYGSAPVGE